MNKTVKRIILTILIIAAVIGAAWGILTLIKNSKKNPVNVYAVSDLYMEGDNWNSAESYGSVYTDKIQKIYLNDGQTVNEVYVSEGQSVKKGDALLAVDTTMAELQVEKADIALQKKKVALQTAEANLTSISNATSREYLESRLKTLQKQLDEEMERLAEEQSDAVILPFGAGTVEEPLYAEYNEGMELSIDILLEEREELWLVFVTVEEGSFTDFQGIKLYKTENGTAFAPFDPIPLSQPELELSDEAESLNKQIDRVYDLMSTSYSASEIARMKAELTKEISNLQLEIKIADIDLQKMQKQMDSGVINSEFDGVVKAVRDADDAFINGQAVLEVSGGGGYYIKGAVSELERDNVQIGQTVNVTSFRDYNIYQGTVCETGDYPVTEADAYTQGNNNVSWYPFTVFVSEDAELQEFDYVMLQYDVASQDSGWYLEKMFIRDENGKSFVYCLGEDNLLKKRYITTGKDLWGSYTQIRGGLSREDYIAFPYGTDVVNGAEAVVAELNELYNY